MQREGGVPKGSSARQTSDEEPGCKNSWLTCPPSVLRGGCAHARARISACVLRRCACSWHPLVRLTLSYTLLLSYSLTLLLSFSFSLSQSLSVSSSSSSSFSSPVMCVLRVGKVFVRCHGTCGACHCSHKLSTRQNSCLLAAQAHTGCVCPLQTRRGSARASHLEDLAQSLRFDPSFLKSSSSLIWLYWRYPSRANTGHVHPCCRLSQASFLFMEVSCSLSLSHSRIICEAPVVSLGRQEVQERIAIFLEVTSE